VPDDSETGRYKVSYLIERRLNTMATAAEYLVMFTVTIVTAVGLLRFVGLVR